MRAIRGGEYGLSSHFPWLKAVDEEAAAFFHWLAFRGYAAVLALTLLCCLLYLPGITTLPVTDRDEARFAQATKQMLETGNYVDIHFQNEPRYKKPIGIYWLQAAAIGAARQAGAALEDIWAYRIPSFLGALAAVLLTFWAARAVIGRAGGLAAAALFATCLTLAFEARIAKSDAALIAAIMLMQGALFRLYLAPMGSRTRWLAAFFWIGLGGAILIKGPVAPGLALFTCAILLWRDRKRGWLKNLQAWWGLPLMLAVTLPWFIAIGISSHGEFFRSSLGQDFAGKLQSGQEKHWGPPGFYFIAFWWTFWPALLFVTADGIFALWRNRHSRRVLFLLAWIIPFWLVIEAIPTKLPHYALPLYPAIAIAAALSLRNKGLMEGHRWRLGPILFAVIGGLQIAVLIALSWVAEAEQMHRLVLISAPLAAVVALTAVAAWRSYCNAALAGAMASGIIFYVAAFAVALPALEPIWISGLAARAAQSLRGCGDQTAGFAGFSPPSLVFLNGTKTVLTAPAPLAEALASDAVGVAFVNWNRREEFEKTFLQKTGSEPRLLGCVDGIDINGRGPTRLQAYARPGTEGRSGCSPVLALMCRDKNKVRWRRIGNSKF